MTPFIESCGLIIRLCLPVIPSWHFALRSVQFTLIFAFRDDGKVDPTQDFTLESIPKDHQIL